MAGGEGWGGEEDLDGERRGRRGRGRGGGGDRAGAGRGVRGGDIADYGVWRGCFGTDLRHYPLPEWHIRIQAGTEIRLIKEGEAVFYAPDGINPGRAVAADTLREK